MERTGPSQGRGRTGGRPDRSDRRERRALIGLELFTGLAALAGGVLLMVKPDGSLLRARASALAGSPFHDWLLPGLLLALLVGVGFTVTALWELHGGRFAGQLSVTAGLGIIVFEGAEVLWIGPQPLEAVFSAVGAAVALLALRSLRSDRSARAGSRIPATERARR